MKRITSFIFAVIFMFNISAYTPAAAATVPGDVVVSLQIDNPVIKINGVAGEIDPGYGTKPVIRGGRTILPIRAVVEAFGGKVNWDGNTRTVSLSLEGDSIRLTIGSTVAYLNNKAQTLDVAPVIIGGRTFLPIRFVAEGFSLGVAWDGKTRTVSVIRNVLDDAEYQHLMSVVPAYSGSPYAVINGNKPMFKSYEIIPASFEYYSKLDGLKRCDVCMASVAEDIMPTDERESISSVTPSGWINAKYDNVPGGYLYNRCHLIGYQLTGENANAKNLITGTRYLNIDGMLTFENKVDDYIERTGNHVMYRVTPVFKGNNLVADGVLMEAYSVEDKGAGLSFCVYCYNVQPGITINYSTGASSLSGSTAVSQPAQSTVTSFVYRTPSGKKYHLISTCGGKNSYQVTLTEAKAAGLTPCAKCAA